MSLTERDHLLVEGNDDRHVIEHILMKNDITVPERFCVEFAQEPGGFALAFATALKSFERIGVILDRDAADNSQYLSHIGQANNAIGNLSDSVEIRAESGGFIADLPNDRAECQRIGLWVMPDNLNPGAIENFLETLVPKSVSDIWDYAREATVEAQKRGAPFTNFTKARLRTWLAWQKQAGLPPGKAIGRGILQPQSEIAVNFVGWFRRLFNFERTSTS